MMPQAESHCPRCAVMQRWFSSSTSILLVVVLVGGGCRPAKIEANQPSPSPQEFATTPAIAAASTDIFEETAAKAGLSFTQQFCDTRIANILESDGSGGAVLDFDQDGFVDIYVVNPGPQTGITHHLDGVTRQPNRLFRNRRDGTFEDVTQKAGVNGHGYAFAAVAGDYDNDGYPDLYVVNVGANILYHNRGDGTFEDVTTKAGVGDRGTGIGAAWLDADGDGRLDLFVANYLTYAPNYRQYFNPDSYPGPLSYKSEFNVLYRNRGDGTFEDVSESAGIRIAGHRAMSVATLDYNSDGASDIYICNDATPNLLLVNDGKGHFKEMAVPAQVAFNAAGEAAGSMSAAVGDYNGDLKPDILVSRLGYGSLYTAWRNGMYEDRLVSSGLGPLTAQYVGWGCHLFDFDNDGDRDALIVNGDPHHMVGWESLLLENRGDGTFADAVDRGGAFFRSKIRGRCGLLLDYNNDGAIDVLVTALADRLFLLRNRSRGAHWLTLDLQGTRGNRDGYGAKATATAGNKSQFAEAVCPSTYLGSSDRRIHFGLGNATQVNVEIRWPGGAIQKLANISTDQIIKVKEP